jgi:hypothetical protein
MRSQYHRAPAKAPREVICQRCGIKFLHRGQGAVKYCIECRDMLITHHNNRIKRRIDEANNQRCAQPHG